MKIKLKEARKKRHLTIRDLERLSGVSKSEISNIETGKVIPRLDVLCRLAQAMNIPCKCELCDCDKSDENPSEYHI